MGTFRSTFGAAGLGLVLSACTTIVVQEPPPPVVPLPPPGPPPIVAGCNVNGALWALGRRATPANLERATLQSGSRIARVISPGQPVTMEFSPDRLTVTVNSRNRIVDLRCG